MITRLGAVIALIEVASIAFVLLLLKQEGLPDKTGVILAFLLPITFGWHVFEEFIFPGGFGDWVKSYRPKLANVVTPSYLFKINFIPLVASVLVSLGAFDYMGAYSFGGIRAWLTFLSILAFNASFHIRGAIQTKRYSPGVVTSIVLYLPLTIISFTYFLRTGAVDMFSAIVCLAIGSVFQSVLDYFKERSMKKVNVSN
jgi:hypothetical protein